MMNNKDNIFEELNKMKSLIHAKSGVVISEQNIATDIDTIVKNIASLSLSSENEKAVVNTIINNSKTKQDFENLLSQFKSKTGKDLATELPKVLQPGRDPNEVSQLKNHLSGIGITMGETKRDGKWEGFSFTGLGGSSSRQQVITTNYCAVKDGKVRYSNGVVFDWNTYASSNKVTEAEIAEAKKTCPNVDVAPSSNTPAPAAGPTPTQRFATTATSLGIQNPKMDVATLQTILNTLNQGGSGLTESKNLVNEELNKMKYIFGYQRGRVISEQDAAQTQQSQPAATQPAATQQAATQQAATQQAATQQATPKDLIRQIQTVLKTKYNANLGKFGAKGDGIDEKWGNLTQTALENAMKSIADVKQRRETETQQTTTQDTAIQQAAETGRMEIPQTNNLPNLPGIQLGNQQKQDIYTTLVNNKTLLTRNQNTVIYNGPDLSSAQRNELEQSMSQKGYRISKDNRDFRSGDKIIFKKN